MSYSYFYSAVNIKDVVAYCHFYLFIFTLIKYTYNVYKYSTTRRVPSCCPHGFRSLEGHLWGAEPRFEYFLHNDSRCLVGAQDL
jgi:hypothetical protein